MTAQIVAKEAEATYADIKEINKRVMPHKDKAAAIAAAKDEWWQRVKPMMVKE